MNAAMFGMIMPDKKVPNRCTATRALPVLLTGTSAFTAILRLRAERRARPTTCIHRAPSRQVTCRAYRGIACASGSAPGPIAYAAADIAIARPFSHPWSGSHRSTNNDIAQVRPSARLLTNSDTR
jgi:hypothetical protein